MSHLPACAVFGRWRLHPGREAAFVAAWSRIIALHRERGRSLGSRLHRGGDGLRCGHAQWTGSDARRRAFAEPSPDPEASRQMRPAIVEESAETIVGPVADFLLAIHA